MSGQLDLSTKTIKIYGGAFDAAARASIAAHLADLDNPHEVVKADVGLGNADNTSDVNKPISTLTAAALALKAPLASPALTGTPTAPTASTGDVSTQIATTANAQAKVNVVAASVAAAQADATEALADAADAQADATAALADAAAAQADADAAQTDADAAQANATQALAETAANQAGLIGTQQAGRPGDAIYLFSSAKIGVPNTANQISPAWVATGDAGAVLRIDAATAADPQTVTTHAAFALDVGRIYQITYRVQRRTNPVDPLNDSVTLGVRWLQSTKAGVVSGGETVVDDLALVVADGVVSRTIRVAAEAVEDATVAPATSVYFRPFIDTFGDSHITDVIFLGLEDITASTIGIGSGSTYRVEAPTTGATITLAAGDENLILNPAAAIADLEIELPAGVDKKQYRISTRQRIGNLVITPTSPDLSDWVTNELPKNGNIGLRFIDALSTWVLS